MQDSSFTRKPLAVAVAVAAGTAFAMPSVSVAQEGEAIEEIVTTGIRGSLTRSMDIKRASRGVVDAISAEDIGKFPDANLAESLQRITGVSIDRQRGEGSQVTVRGFGPEFNLVTINGRQMPTHNGVNRSYDFADLASEGVAGVNVYKTGRADVPSGGIGSTISRRLSHLKVNLLSASRPRRSRIRRPAQAIRSRRNSPGFTSAVSRTTRLAYPSREATRSAIMV